eukprot:169640_1
MAKKDKKSKEAKEGKDKHKKKKAKDDKKHKSSHASGESSPKDDAVPSPAEIRPTVPLTDSNRCDGCFSQVGEVYCVSCDRILCISCNKTAHSLKADAEHKRVPVADATLHRVLCTSHPRERVRYYCETCQCPICQECTVVGQHAGAAHLIVALEQAYRDKIQMLQSIVDSKLLPKKNTIIQQMRALEQAMASMNGAAETIHREILSDAQTIRDRLDSVKASKMATLEVDTNNLRADLRRISDFSAEMISAKSSARDLYAFLMRATELAEGAKRLAARPVKREINVTTDDFPKETRDRLEKLERYEQLRSLIKAKDDMLWFLLSERDRFQSQERVQVKHIKDLDRATNDEMQQWIKLTERFSGALQEFQLCCRYCGLPMNERNVNAYCEANCAVRGSARGLHSRTTGHSRRSSRGSRTTEESDAVEKFGEPGTGLHHFIKY